MRRDRQSYPMYNYNSAADTYGTRSYILYVLPALSYKNPSALPANPIRSVSLAKSFPNDDDEHKTRQAADQRRKKTKNGRAREIPGEL